MNYCEYNNCMPCMPYTQMPGMQNLNCSMLEMPDQELEKMYPKVHHIVYPHVKQHCDRMINEHGMMHNPTREQMNAIVEDICCKVEADVEIEIKTVRASEERQILGFGGRRLLGDLAAILLIRELLSRRGLYGTYPGYFNAGFPGYYGVGYPGYFGGYSYY